MKRSSKQRKIARGEFWALNKGITVVADSYEQLREQAITAEIAADEALAQRVERLMAWSNNRKRRGGFWQ